MNKQMHGIAHSNKQVGISPGNLAIKNEGEQREHKKSAAQVGKYGNHGFQGQAAQELISGSRSRAFQEM